MTTLLKTVFSMSLTGSIAILIVLLVRLFLKRSPKIFSYILWSVVLFRLLCPVSVSSPLSLLGIAEKENDVQTSLADSAKADTPFPAAGQEDIQPGYKPNLSVADHSQGHEIETEKTGKITGWEAAAAIWILGIFFMCCYCGYSFVGAKRLLAGGIHKEGNIYEIDWEVSPFVLGVISPKICLPYWLDGQEREYVLLHERTHIKRGDHILKLFAFLALSLHWFNPLVWLAFYLAEKDMEMSCDETVMRRMASDIRTSYATSLLNLSTGGQLLAGGPLSFGENAIKDRIKNVMRYKKPKLHAVLLAVFAIAVCIVSLGSNPRNTNSAQIGEEPDIGSDVKEPDDDVGSDVKEPENIEEIERELTKWAQALCGRDGDTILEMSSQEARQSLIDKDLLTVAGGEASVGMSSPWMWDETEDFLLINTTADKAEILYYAWTSDPHVTVWKETLSYHMEEDSLSIDTEEMQYYDYICTGEEFLNAYPAGIAGSRMDYLANGTGESLNNNALLSGSKYYKNLFSPDTAAVALLNLLDNQNKVTATIEAEQEDGSVTVRLAFKEDGTMFDIRMIQPYEKDGFGIWIPQSYVQETILP